MQTAVLTNEGQIDLPKPVQEALGVRPGDRVGFEIREDGTIVVRAEPAENWASGESSRSAERIVVCHCGCRWSSGSSMTLAVR
jgi:AbrB family looped-hinge helix DNA binding protein